VYQCLALQAAVPSFVGMTNRVIRLQNIDDMTKLFRNAFTHTAVEKPPIGLKAFIKHKNFYLNLTHYGAVIPTQEGTCILRKK